MDARCTMSVGGAVNVEDLWTPWLAAGALAVDGVVSGRSIGTRQAPETTDDPGIEGHAHGTGQLVPWLAAWAQPTDSGLPGRTVATKAKETTDE
jgi:hypothetical protein